MACGVWGRAGRIVHTGGIGGFAALRPYARWDLGIGQLAQQLTAGIRLSGGILGAGIGRRVPLVMMSQSGADQKNAPAQHDGSQSGSS